MSSIAVRAIHLAMQLPAAVEAVGAVTMRLVNRTNGTLVSSGEKRAYLLYVPDRYDPTTPTPLVISIHGFAEWPAHQRQISHWNHLADREGFLIVYPSGTRFPLRWRTHSAPGTAEDYTVDVTFIGDLIDKLANAYNIDQTRIYANGLSNGGGMSFALACGLSERIAAFGGVAGAYFLSWDACLPARPVPAIIFHGTGDPIVPYAGAPSRSSGLPFPAIPEWVAELAARNGCGGVPDPLPRHGEVTGVHYTGCGADVAFYTIDGGGHSWPGGKAMPRAIVGHTTQDVDATRLMWQFFQAHPLEPG